jgi:hypothetical protein
MRLLSVAAGLCLSLSSGLASTAADELFDQLVTCRVSWLDWKDDPVQGRKFADAIHAAFVQQPRGPAWTPKNPVTVLGMPVVEAFPESVGMGVGFSVTVDATFEQARGQMEKSAGKTFKECDRGEGMRTCELMVAEKRTLFLLSGESGKGKTTTLIGCYYFYAR